MEIEEHKSTTGAHILRCQVTQEERLSLPRFSENRRMLASLGVQQISSGSLDFTVHDLEAKIQPRPDIR
jgi:hypothetical protein